MYCVFMSVFCIKLLVYCQEQKKTYLARVRILENIVASHPDFIAIYNPQIRANLLGIIYYLSGYRHRFKKRLGFDNFPEI